MRLFLILGLMAGALTTGTEVRGAEAPEESESFKSRYVITREEMCATLKAETGKTFYVDKEADGRVKLKSEAGNTIVWWSTIPEIILTRSGYKLIQLRFDNFGGAQGYKYHFHVVDNEKGSDNIYLVFVQGSKATLHTHPETPQVHLNLIEAWADTMSIDFSVLKGVPVTSR